MSARTIATVALIAVVLNGASVSALPCGRGVRVGYAQAPQEARDVASSDFELTAREPLFRDKILPAAQRGVSKVWNGAKNQATKIIQDPGKYVDRVGTIAQGASTVIGAFGGRPQAPVNYRSYDEESLELREEELAALEELLARDPLFRDKILPAAQRGVSKVWNGAKNQATKIIQDPGKYVDRVSTIAQGASTVLGAFGGRPQYREYDDESMELRDEEIAALEELLAREPLFRDKILPAVGRGVSKVWNGAKNQATKIAQDPGKYADRVSTIAQGAGTVLGAFGGRPAAPAYYRELEDALLELRDEDLADFADWSARELDELD